MKPETNKAAAREFANALATTISDALNKATGTPWPLQVSNSPEAPTQNSQTVQLRLTVDGGLKGECFIEWYEPAVSDLGSKLGGSSDDTVIEHSRRLVAVLSAGMIHLGNSLGTAYGELQFKLECVSGLAFGGMFVVPLAASADASGAPVLLYFDNRLMRAFAGESLAPPVFNPMNLKLVMDVELSVSLRFGQRKLPLREVLELGSGSVIELDRMVDEPVELLLDGKVVARGEAVIVDGNYGLRVTEIPQAIETHFCG